VRHRTSRYTNNRIEQDHRAMQQRYYPTRGFGSIASAARCCSACEEQRQYCRAQARSGEFVSLAERRRRFQGRGAAVLAALTAQHAAVSAASPRPAHSRAASAVPILTQPLYPSRMLKDVGNVSDRLCVCFVTRGAGK